MASQKRRVKQIGAGMKKSRTSWQLSQTSWITQNVWILTSAPSTVITALTLICQGETTKFITVKKPIHILHLPPACSATSPHFHLPPWYEHPDMTSWYQHFSWHGKPQHGHIISSLDFHIWKHLKDHRNASPFVKHTLSSNYPTLQTHDHWHQTYDPFHITYWVNSWYRITLDTMFSHRRLCNCYRITYTSWIRDLLLLLLLVSTCQVSPLTFTTRFYMIYYCAWWCRGSTQTAYKTSWESWPAYGTRTYTDREPTEATNTVIRSSCLQIIGYHIQNPGNMIMYILSVVRLRIEPAVAPLCIDGQMYLKWQWPLHTTTEQ